MDSEQIQPQTPPAASNGPSSWPPSEPNTNPALDSTGAVAGKPSGLADTFDNLASQTGYNPPNQTVNQSPQQPTDFSFLPNSNTEASAPPAGVASPSPPIPTDLATPTIPLPPQTNTTNTSLNNSLTGNTMSQNSQPTPTQPANNPPEVTTFNADSNSSPKPLSFNPPSQPKKKRGKLKYALIALIALIAIGGGASAAYFGYVVPNKPENKLLSAIANTATQTQVTVKGKVEVQTKQPAASYNVSYTLVSDLTKHNLGLSGTVGVKGLQFPFDVRYIDKDIYIKLGGLASISKLAPLAKNNLQAATYLSFLGKINDQWYVVDSSLIDASTQAKCVTDVSWALTKEDNVKIKAAYKKHPLFSVNSATSATVDGKTLTKYDLKPASDAEASAFAKELNSLSIVENINKCFKGSSTSTSSGDQQLNSVVSKATSEKIYVYVGDNKIKRIELSSTEDNTSFTFTANFDYTAPALEKPTGAKPIQDLLGDVLGPLYSNMGANSASPLLQ